MLLLARALIRLGHYFAAAHYQGRLAKAYYDTLIIRHALLPRPDCLRAPAYLQFKN